MLIAIPRANKKKISGKIWYTRKHLFKTKEGSPGEISKQNGRDIWKKTNSRMADENPTLANRYISVPLPQCLG